VKTIRLPKDLAAASLDELNREILQGTVALDWSQVEVASDGGLRRLLRGVDLVANHDALGVDTVPDALSDSVAVALDDAVVEQDPAEAPGDVQEGEAPAEGVHLAPPPPEELRFKLEDLVLRDLLGPSAGPEEEIDERSVSERYLVGLLAPRKRRKTAPEPDDELGCEPGVTPEEGSSDIARPAADSLFPSSIGFTFCIAPDAPPLRLTASWGWYRRRASEILRDEKGGPKLVWRRTPAGGTSQKLLIREGPIQDWCPNAEQPGVIVRGVARRTGQNLIVTVFLVNDQDEPERSRDEAWLFQPQLCAEAAGGEPVFLKRSESSDPEHLDPLARDEHRSMAMLYRNRVEFAVGHGVAVHAEAPSGDATAALRIETRVVPRLEVPAVEPPSAQDNPEIAPVVLDMNRLGELGREELLRSLEHLPKAYAAWISRQQARAEVGEEGLAKHREAAKQALERCRRACKRIEEGIALLASDGRSLEAFQFANRAMAMQRVRTVFGERRRRGDECTIADVDQPKNRSWRLFQLAFVVLNLPSITDLHHPDRSSEMEAIADLLWFPTGGGKTEAYLGLAAYTMALRRLQGPVEGRSGEHGIAVLMRYTLRVLTLQQFQRAAALVCACEVLRREALGRLGKEPFRIGLWVGQKTTPNWTDQAAEALKQEHGTQGRPSHGDHVGSPAQLTNCPWCGTPIDPGKHMEVSTYSKGTCRTYVYCGDPLGNCPFSRRQAKDEGIPIVVVDEEVYRRLPAMLIATVDKFAQMPWNGTTQMLFGQVDHHCPRHGFWSPEIQDSDHPKSGALPRARSVAHGPLRPPDLIIQDELHLISGPLGTLTGLYETAVDELCGWEVEGRRVRPKVIASTATIQRASDQVWSLFQRRVEVFPPSGTEVRDNFFALERTPAQKPGRLYLGICAPGRRLKSALIRAYVALLAASKKLYDDCGRAADPWMTLVGYFSSIRELAGMRRLVDDDVRSRLNRTDRRGLARRRAPLVQELTSRIGSTDIPDLLDRMEIAFDPVDEKARRELWSQGKKTPPKPIDVLLATNMISVGVDIRRLGLMVVAGQPKTTAEYIQATSRVGRSQPGLVVAVYNWARPRDLSHYERFEHYHSTFYRHVEPTSVTPFAARALDRGLSALLVSLVRLASQELNANNRAQAITDKNPLVLKALERIVERARKVTGDDAIAEQVRAMLGRRLDVWLADAGRRDAGSMLGYRESRDRTRGLLRAAEAGTWQEFTCLNSLRDVEPSVGLIFDERGLDFEGREQEPQS
jgi:hypothetical protein